MSGDHPDWVDIDKLVKVHNTVKQISDYWFTSDGYEGDIIILEFTDGTQHEGLHDVNPATENDLFVSELRKLQRTKIKHQSDIEYEKFLEELKEKHIGFKRLAKLYLKLLKETQYGILDSNSDTQ